MQVWVLEYRDGETGGFLGAYASPDAAADDFKREALNRFHAEIDTFGRRLEAYRDDSGAYVFEQGFDVLLLAPAPVLGASQGAARPALGGRPALAAG